MTPGDDTSVAILEVVGRAGEGAGERCTTAGSFYDWPWIRNGFLRFLEIILQKLRARSGANVGLILFTTQPRNSSYANI